MATEQDKITDEHLLRLASGEGPDATTVIVEVDVPRVRMNVDEGGGIGRRFAIQPESDDDRAQADAAVSQVRTLLEGIADEPPVWLGASSAFVATLLPRHLLALAGSPFVRAIRPNVLHR